MAVSLEPRADQVRVARQRVASLCKGMAGDRVQAAQLLVSELVTNAIRRHPSKVTVGARRLPHQLRVDVREEAATPAAVPDAAPLGHHRAGAVLLARLASSWGVKWAGSGGRTTVWFNLSDR